MAKIHWEKFYNVNVKELDQQHREFIDLMNEAYDKLERHRSLDVFDDFFEKLQAHADVHFGTEEKYFKTLDYPHAAAHTASHNMIREKIAVYQRKFQTHPSSTLIYEVIRFMDDWLFEHNVRHDKKYTKFFNERGVE